MNEKMTELTFEELDRISGGDYFEAEWGMLLSFAFLAGALAAPELVVGAALVGLALVSQ